MLRRLPTGALTACLIIAAIHTIVGRCVYPYPVAADRLRDKAAALTRTNRPSVLIAGDSRAAWGVIPDVLAARAGVPAAEIVNIAVRNCETQAVAALYREFAGRFAPCPIMLLSVSFWSVNDHINRGPGARFTNDETLWSMGLLDRLRVVAPKRALNATFLPEKTLWRRLTASAERPAGWIGERGFRSATKHITSAPETLAGRVGPFARDLYADAEIDGVCWRQFENALKNLSDAGVQVILLSTPEHPAFLDALVGTEEADNAGHYQRKLAGLSARMNIPLLRYAPDRFEDADINSLYRDVLHLNRTGATKLSTWIGDDLGDLLARGAVRLPNTRVATAPTE